MQEYKLKDFKDSDFKDQNSNTWCDAIFEGHGEPVKWVVKDPMKIRVGDSFYGEIKQMTSKAGKQYNRFYRAQKPDHTTNAEKDKYWEDKNQTIRAQWAIGQAVSATEMKASDEGYEADVQGLASKFYEMVDRVVKGIPKEMDDVIGDPTLEADKFNLDDIPY